MRTEIEQDSDKNKLGAVEYRCKEVGGDGKLPSKVRPGNVERDEIRLKPIGAGYTQVQCAKR
jgi:hypothetical protein